MKTRTTEGTGTSTEEGEARRRRGRGRTAGVKGGDLPHRGTREARSTGGEMRKASRSPCNSFNNSSCETILSLSLYIYIFKNLRISSFVLLKEQKEKTRETIVYILNFKIAYFRLLVYNLCYIHFRNPIIWRGQIVFNGVVFVSSLVALSGSSCFELTGQLPVSLKITVFPSSLSP